LRPINYGEKSVVDNIGPWWGKKFGTKVVKRQMFAIYCRQHPKADWVKVETADF
jgi:hypothetical protein